LNSERLSICSHGNAGGGKLHDLRGYLGQRRNLIAGRGKVPEDITPADKRSGLRWRGGSRWGWRGRGILGPTGDLHCPPVDSSHRGQTRRDLSTHSLHGYSVVSRLTDEVDARHPASHRHRHWYKPNPLQKPLIPPPAKATPMAPPVAP